jgi:hypothetical protein
MLPAAITKTSSYDTVVLGSAARECRQQYEVHDDRLSHPLTRQVFSDEYIWARYLGRWARKTFAMTTDIGRTRAASLQEDRPSYEEPLAWCGE